MEKAAVAFAAVALAAVLVPASALALVNINTAGATELDTLEGIGAVKARAIVEYREANGPFATIEEIMDVDGIGEATFAGIKDQITVGESVQAPPEDTETDKEATSTPQDKEEEQDTEKEQEAQPAPVSSYVPPPVPTLFADGGDDRTVIVGADVEFDGRAYNREGEDVERVRFLWNFGDGSTAEGTAVLHHYTYPGRYQAVLTIAQNRQAVSDLFVVTAEPARLTFAAQPDGSVTIGNLAGHDLDLSSWIVRSFGQYFELPEHTIVLAGASLRIPQQTLNFYAGSQTKLQYPNGVDAPVEKPSSSQASAATASTKPSQASALVARATPAPVSRKTVVSISTAHAESQSQESDAATSSSAQNQTAAAGRSFASVPWWAGAVALALLSGGAAAYMRRQKKGEWDIAEIEQ